MIVGIGADVVDVARLGRMLERTPALAGRLFTEVERGLPLESLAARVAAKEAVGKALGSPPGLGWREVSVARGEHGAPVLSISGAVEALARARGVATWHLSLTHDAGVAVAFVVAEG